jgi:hypothetical protein
VYQPIELRQLAVRNRIEDAPAVIEGIMPDGQILSVYKRGRGHLQGRDDRDEAREQPDQYQAKL